jgi:hypothetical protein
MEGNAKQKEAAFQPWMSYRNDATNGYQEATAKPRK